MAKKQQVDPVVEAYRLGEEFQREVNAVLHEQFDGDIGHPGWMEYCAALDELAATRVWLGAEQAWIANQPG